MIECRDLSRVDQASLWNTMMTEVEGRTPGYVLTLHASILTSLSDLLTEIISLTTKLNWLILNFSFLISIKSEGVFTLWPISPGAPSVIGTGSREWYLWS